MAIDPIGAATGATPATAVTSPRETFGEALRQTRPSHEGAGPGAAAGAAPRLEIEPVRAEAAAGPGAPTQFSRVEAAKVVDQVAAAQERLDQVLALAQSGRTFTPAELLALQARVFRASQELDLAGKVVEKATAGVKQVLQVQT